MSSIPSYTGSNIHLAEGHIEYHPEYREPSREGYPEYGGCAEHRKVVSRKEIDKCYAIHETGELTAYRGKLYKQVILTPIPEQESCLAVFFRKIFGNYGYFQQPERPINAMILSEDKTHEVLQSAHQKIGLDPINEQSIQSFRYKNIHNVLMFVDCLHMTHHVAIPYIIGDYHFTCFLFLPLGEAKMTHAVTFYCKKTGSPIHEEHLIPAICHAYCKIFIARSQWVEGDPLWSSEIYLDDSGRKSIMVEYVVNFKSCRDNLSSLEDENKEEIIPLLDDRNRLENFIDESHRYLL